MTQGDIPKGVVLKASGGEIVITDGNPHYGITTCNIPIVTQFFVQGYPDQKTKNFTRGFNKLKERLDLGRWPHPELPSRQILWILFVVYFQFMGDYWLRHISPDFTEEFAKGVDRGILKLFETTIGINTTN